MISASVGLSDLNISLEEEDQKAVVVVSEIKNTAERKRKC